MSQAAPHPVLLFGASQGTGLLLAQTLHALQVPIVALVRPASDAAALTALGVRLVSGNALCADDVAQAFALAGRGCHVISTLGGREGNRLADDEGNIQVIDHATANDAARFVLVTSIGCGDMAPFRSARAIAAFGTTVDAKTRAEQHLRTALPTGTIVRPGGLKSQASTGLGILSTDPQIHGFIQRADLADLILRTLRNASTIGGTFAAVDASMAHCANPIQPFPLDD